MHKWAFVIVLNFFFALFLSLTLGVSLPLMNGAPLTTEGVLMALVWGTPVACIFSTVCPLMQWGVKWATITRGVPAEFAPHKSAPELATS